MRQRHWLSCTLGAATVGFLGGFAQPEPPAKPAPGAIERTAAPAPDAPSESSKIDVLKVAQEVAAPMAKWTYGSDATKQQIDCVQFVLAVVKKLEPALSKEAETRILISDIKPEDAIADKDGLVSKGDAKTKGVQQALVDAGVGEAVKLDDVQPGDFLQYWMKKKDGTWFGHAGIIHEVKKNKRGQPLVFLYGSHQSTGGIGIGPEKGLVLIEATDQRITSGELNDRRMYLVRYKPKA